MGEKDDYDSENSWISDRLPNINKEGGEAMGGGRGESGESSEVHAQESPAYLSAHEPSISARESCMSSREIYVSAHDPCIFAPEPCIFTKSHAYVQTSPIYLQKSHA